MSKVFYKYNPTNFEQVLGLAGELVLFYKLHEEYEKDKMFSNRGSLEKHSVDLFFTLKHRSLEGAITRDTAYGIKKYMEELLYEETI